jgi:hypothetical protein
MGSRGRAWVMEGSNLVDREASRGTSWWRMARSYWGHCWRWLSGEFGRQGRPWREVVVDPYFACILPTKFSPDSCDREAVDEKPERGLGYKDV